MRVVSGKYRGRYIKLPVSDNIRPTADKVKQALFTKLQFFVPGKVVCDLFCGSGALGLEAISHGANETYFVDADHRSIKLTKENLVGITEKFSILNCDYSVALNKFDKQIDLFLIDPPYASGVYDNVLKLIEDYKLLSDEGIIVCEHPNGMEIHTNFKLFDQKRYGTVTLSYFSK